jgi:hypothetical protein
MQKWLGASRPHGMGWLGAASAIGMPGRVEDALGGRGFAAVRDGVHWLGATPAVGLQGRVDATHWACDALRLATMEGLSCEHCGAKLVE